MQHSHADECTSKMTLNARDISNQYSTLCNKNIIQIWLSCMPL